MLRFILHLVSRGNLKGRSKRFTSITTNEDPRIDSLLHIYSHLYYVTPFKFTKGEVHVKPYFVPTFFYSFCSKTKTKNPERDYLSVSSNFPLSPTHKVSVVRMCMVSLVRRFTFKILYKGRKIESRSNCLKF